MKSIIINKGSKAGVLKGMPVIDKEYLVGRVVETNYLSSRVLLLNDLNSRIPVTFGEDGKIQKFLESINIPYTGSGILSSSLGMDKFKCKKIWKSKKIQTPDFMKIDDSNQFEKASNLCGLPFFIKPANSGSSIGIAKVSNKKEFIKIKSTGIINRNKKIFFPAKTLNGKSGTRLALSLIHI